MNFTEEFLRKMCAGNVIGDFSPFDSGKIKEVEEYLKKLVGHLSGNHKIVLKADFDSYGSGFASYVSIKVSKRDKSDTKITRNGNRITEWTDGLLLYISKLTPYWYLGASDWTVNFEDEQWKGGSGGFLSAESFNEIDQTFWHTEIRDIKKTFDEFRYNLLTEQELNKTLWFDIKIPTILASKPFQVFDCFFYWED